MVLAHPARPSFAHDRLTKPETANIYYNGPTDETFVCLVKITYKYLSWRRRSDDLAAESVGPSSSRGNRPPQIGKQWKLQDNWHAKKNPVVKSFGDGKPQQTYHPIGFKFLESTTETTNPDDALNEIMSKKSQLFEFLALSYSLDDCDKYMLLMKILDRVSKSSFNQMKSQLLLEVAKSKLCENLQLYLTKLPYQNDWEKSRNRHFWNNPLEFWENFLNYCESVYTLSPYYAFEKFRPVMDVASAHCLPLLAEKHGFKLPEECAQRLKTIKKKISVRETQSLTKETNQKKHIDYGPAPENFRALNVYPCAKDLFEFNPYLRPNIVDGSYESGEHYLDVQFRLLREDCYGPLRIGIQQFRNDMTKKRYDNIRVYRKVIMTEPIKTKNQFGVVVKWDTSKTKYSHDIDWSQSKRFMFGSLLLFFKDNCSDFILGTVLNRDVNFLSRGLVVVQIYKADLLDEKLFEANYHMLECQVYFEPYFHVLKALQDPQFSEHLPMSKYIVSVNHTPTPPAYLTESTRIDVSTTNGIKTFTVLNDATWPEPHEIDLDASQYEAYKSALTQEFVVIQGPPGTGKTYLGVKIAKTFLKNSWRFRNIRGNLSLRIGDPGTCRILVLCYTNHALDQFLESILPTTQSIVRIGGRSKNENLDTFNLTQIRAYLISLIKFLRKRKNGRYNYEFDDDYDEDYDFEFFCMRMDNPKVFKAETLNMAEKYLTTYRYTRDKLEVANTRLAVCQKKIDIFNEGVYSFESIRNYCEEIAFLEGYQYDSTDPLLFWLFEHVDMDGTEIDLKSFIHEVNEEESKVADELQFNVDDIGIIKDEEFGEFNYEFLKASFLESDVVHKLKGLYEVYEDPETSFIYKYDIECQMKHIQSRLLFFQNIIKNRKRLRKVHILDKEHVSDFTTEERWSIYFDWASTVKKNLISEFRILKSRQESYLRLHEESRMIIDLCILREAEVIGVTTTGAARIRKLLKALKTPIVIVEEAAEVLEAHIISALTKDCQHLIMIGDHQQLRPSAAHYKLAQHFNMEISLFERMVKTGAKAPRLRLQHRMRPEIAALISPAIYPDLLNHPSVLQYPPVRGLTTNVFFFTHDNREEDNDEMLSHSNYFEADMMLRLANYLMKQGYRSEDITILATYSSQMVYLKNNRSDYPFLKNVKITVVDDYQGEESKIILLSLVRNNEEGNVGFLATDNRVCVALSRAREGMYIMGNIDMLKKKSELWTKIAATLESNGSLGTSFVTKCQQHPDDKIEVQCPDDFLKVPEGGCLRKCEGLLECGHGCPLVCHSYDNEHMVIACTAKCNRILCPLGHICPKACEDDCDPCQVIMKKEMPCGHTNELFCHVEPDSADVKCRVKVTVALPACGHEIEKPCHINLNDAECPIKCRERLQCGHTCKNNCHKNKDPDHEHYECRANCARTKAGCSVVFADGDDFGEHKCFKLCYEECDPCLVNMTKKRSNCTHRGIIECSKDVDSTQCMKKCSRALPCKHFCKNKCFEPCTPNCTQLVTKTIPDCGHKVRMACSDIPVRESCDKNCERVLACGHVCIMKCTQECDCDRKMDSSITLPENARTGACADRMRSTV